MNDTSGLILVTGSNGRIGSALMQRLTGKYGQVKGFDPHAPAPPPPDCVRIAVDIGSDESVKEGLRMLRAHHGWKIASMIHLAADCDFLGEPTRNAKVSPSRAPAACCEDCKTTSRSNNLYFPARCWCIPRTGRTLF